MDSQNNEVILLKSGKDNTSVEIYKNSTRLSNLLQETLEDYRETEITIPNILGNDLQMIAKYLNYYKDKDPIKAHKPLAKFDIAEIYGEWEDDFISKYNDILWNVMEIANYLDIKSLFELAASKIACNLKDYTADEMMKYFDLEENMTEEEIKKMEEDFEKEMNNNRTEKFLNEEKFRVENLKI